MVGVLFKNVKYISQRLVSQFSSDSFIERTLNRRVIGLLAHVDAGKTTTTERLLYITGKIDHCGDVNRGNTVTDFQELEIKRGITINSATVSFPWKEFKVNLIDTPGHLDFSIEVQAALSLIQGGVIILDGTAGVEAQTSRLWYEMSKHDIPRIAYINKCDRKQADFDSSLKSIDSHFGVQVLPIVRPLEGNKSLVNILTGDEISLVNDKEVRKPLSSSHKFYDEWREARMQLIDSVSSLDDIVAEKVLQMEKLDVFSNEELRSAIRRITIAQTAVPVFAGSSYQGIGVTDLLDGIVDYLPCPSESKMQEVVKCLRNSFCARIFKVFRTSHKGMVTFAYVLSGTIKKGNTVYNACTKKTETICASSKAFSSFEDQMVKELNIPKKECLWLLQGKINIPAPVLYSYVEPVSQVEQLYFQQALRDIHMEDPSIHVSNEGHEIVVGGQGKLHFEVFQDKLKSAYNLDVKLSKPRISYCEVPRKSVQHFQSTQKSNVGRDVIEMDFSLLRSEEFSNEIVYEDLNILDISPPRLIKAFESGIKLSFTSGPNLHLPICQTKVLVHSLNLMKCRALPFTSSAASVCVKKAFAEADCGIAEPLMDLNIIIDKVTGRDIVSIVKSDLNSKGALSVSESDKGSRWEIQAVAPLRNLDDYFSHLLSLTSGRASLSLKYSRHSLMAPKDEQEVYNMLTL